MNTLYSPRFVHMQDSLDTKKFSGFTIAYLRTESQLFFAYSLVNRKDKYIKSIGRELSSDLLVDNIDDILGDSTYINPQIRCGCITIEELRSMPEVTYMMADSMASKLNFMDFKHAFLSSVLGAFVGGAIELTEEPRKVI